MMKVLVCLSIIAVAAQAQVSRSDCNDQTGDFCFELWTFTYGYHSYPPSEYCEKVDRTFAAIDSAEKQSWVEEFLNWAVTLPYYVEHVMTFAGSDRNNEGTFSVDGVDLTYYNWDAGQPNGGASENCLSLSRASAFMWSDMPCDPDYTVNILCEMKKEDAILG